MQLEIPFRIIKVETSWPNLTHELEGWLLTHPGWHTAKEIGNALCWNDRWIRGAAAASDQIVSGPGSPGYRHIRNCEAGEIRDIVATLRSQARAMNQRAIRLEKAGHRLIG
jgi:hypothetical protein